MHTEFRVHRSQVPASAKNITLSHNYITSITVKIVTILLNDG